MPLRASTDALQALAEEHIGVSLAGSLTDERLVGVRDCHEPLRFCSTFDAPAYMRHNPTGLTFKADLERIMW